MSGILARVQAGGVLRPDDQVGRGQRPALTSAASRKVAAAWFWVTSVSFSCCGRFLARGTLPWIAATGASVPRPPGRPAAGRPPAPARPSPPRPAPRPPIPATASRRRPLVWLGVRSGGPAPPAPPRPPSRRRARPGNSAAARRRPRPSARPARRTGSWPAGPRGRRRATGPAGPRRPPTRPPPRPASRAARAAAAGRCRHKMAKMTASARASAAHPYQATLITQDSSGTNRATPKASPQPKRPPQAPPGQRDGQHPRPDRRQRPGVHRRERSEQRQAARGAQQQRPARAEPAERPGAAGPRPGSQRGLGDHVWQPNRPISVRHAGRSVTELPPNRASRVVSHEGRNPLGYSTEGRTPQWGGVHVR